MLSALFMAVLLGSGCAEISTRPSSTKPLPAVQSQAVDSIWQSVDQGVNKIEYGSVSSVQLTLYRFSPTSTFRWEWKQDVQHPKTISEWQQAHPAAKLIINGVYFLEDYTPAGLLIINHERVGQRRFDDDKSGMIDLSPSPRIINTQREPLDPKLLDQVGQSYPFLITNGEEAIKTDSGLFARRTIMGTDQQGNIYLGILSEPMTLFTFMKRLTSLDIFWKEVLNLDGGPSSGIVTNFAQDQTFISNYTRVPNVINIESAPI